MVECIVFTGGGTGGHVYPALAVLDELAKHGGHRIVWIGSGSELERRILAGRDLRYYGIRTGKLRRYFSLQNFLDFFKILVGFIASLFIMLRERPSLVFSKGGYVSVPPAAAARLVGIPVFTHESDLRPGLATRINARFAARIFISFDLTSGYFDESCRSKLVHTGNPIRAGILRGDAEKGRGTVGCTRGRKMLLVLGGSLGSAFINRLVLKALDRLVSTCYVVHQLGAEHYEGISQPHRDNYFPKAFFYEELPDILAAADLVVCRAGANTLWELAALGKPAVLIPLPQSASRGDQIENARFFARAGAAEVMEQAGLSAAAWAESVLNLIGNAGKLDRMAQSAAALGRPDAAHEIARLIAEQVQR